MEKFEGKSILKGVAIGKIHYYSKGEQVVQRVSVEDTEAELQRYETAKETALEQLHELYEKALKEVGEVNAAIFDVHAMMLEDDDFNDSIRNTISSQKVNAEYAVGFANTLVALTMIVCAHVEMLVVFPVIPPDILLFILYAGLVSVG